MRVVFINMHCNAFIVNPMIYLLQKQTMPNRHKSFVKKLINEGIKVVNFITLKGTTIYHRYSIVHYALKRLSVYKMEAKYVLEKNGLGAVINVTDEAELNIQDDDLVIYYEFYVNSFNDYIFSKGKNVIDMSHFYGYSGNAEFIKNLKPAYMIAEINLKEYSSLFSKNYGWFDGEIIIRPFSFENRFIRARQFNERKNKCFASGTLANLHVDSDVHFEYMTEYITKYMQPQREKIQKKSIDMKEYIDCISYDFDEAVNKNHIKNSGDYGWIVREYIFWKNYLFGNKFPSYYSDFNMVDKYNEYRLFACGEDANGIYAIGAIEGMACGAAYIGMDYGAYYDLGLKPDFHFVTYDGSMEDFSEKVMFYLSDKQEGKLKMISNNGFEYVNNNFSEHKIDCLYINSLRRIWKE